MWKLAGLLGLPLTGIAQAPSAWGGGLSVGNVLEAHVGYQHTGWLLLGRTTYHWWGPSEGIGSSWLDSRNTSSRQLEAAVLGGYGVRIGQGMLYGGLGLGYVNGRQLGDYRYALVQSGLLGSKAYYFTYRDYQALGLPMEAGALLKPWGNFRFSAALQVDFNPERNLYCGVLGFWLGNFGNNTRPR